MSGLPAPLALFLGGSGPAAAPVLAIDPPGLIGLVDSDPTVLLRFDEDQDSIRPQDAVGSLGDLDVAFGLTMPVVENGVTGRARRFDPSLTNGLVGSDIVSGSSLLTRDASIQVILSWDVAGQDAAGAPGTIVTRGLNTSSAQRCPYGLELVVTSAATSRGVLRWFWHTVAGVLKVQSSADLIMPSGFTMLTATRRWVSPTEVVIRYYAGDLLVGQDTSSDGDIGGGTTGTFQVGARVDSGVPGSLFAGVIDEILIVDRELTAEEVEATWLRLTRYQPLGIQLWRESHDPGFPQSQDPASLVQLENRLIGNALGFAAATAENMRANALPGRSYGTTLADWETVVRVTPAPSSGIDERRARVVARMRQRRGVSIGGLEDALVGLLGGAENSDLEFLAFSNNITDDFGTMNLSRWDVTPVGAFAAVASKARVAPGAGTFLMDGTTRTWRTCAAAVGGDAKAAHAIVKLVLTTPQSVGEAGLHFGDVGVGNYILLGLRDNAGSFQIVTECFVANVSQGLVVQATPGANPAAIWFHLYQTAVDGIWKAAWSTTSATAGYTTSADIAHPTAQNRAGMYLRSTGAIGAAVADFDDFQLYAPFGTRPFNAYVLLDSALGFNPDVVGATSVIQAIKHAYTHGCFIESRNLLCDTPFGCDCGPMGGI